MHLQKLFNFASCKMALLKYEGVYFKGQVLFVVVNEPGRALRDEVKAKGEGHQEDARDQSQPIPLEVSAH